MTIVETDRRLTEIEAMMAIVSDHDSLRAIWRSLILKHSVRGKQVHDARLVALMLAHGITHILTLNTADFARYPQITVIDPSAP